MFGCIVQFILETQVYMARLSVVSQSKRPSHTDNKQTPIYPYLFSWTQNDHYRRTKMKGSTTRYRIRERYWTVDEIATEACMTHAGVWSRIRAGVTGEALLQRVPDKGRRPGPKGPSERSSRQWPRQIQAHLSQLRTLLRHVPACAHAADDQTRLTYNRRPQRPDHRHRRAIAS